MLAAPVVLRRVHPGWGGGRCYGHASGEIPHSSHRYVPLSILSLLSSLSSLSSNTNPIHHRPSLYPAGVIEREAQAYSDNNLHTLGFLHTQLSGFAKISTAPASALQGGEEDDSDLAVVEDDDGNDDDDDDEEEDKEEEKQQQQRRKQKEEEEEAAEEKRRAEKEKALKRTPTSALKTSLKSAGSGSGSGGKKAKVRFSS